MASGKLGWARFGRVLGKRPLRFSKSGAAYGGGLLLIFALLLGGLLLRERSRTALIAPPCSLPQEHEGVGVSLNPLRLMVASLLQGVAPCKPPLVPAGPAPHHHLHLTPQQVREMSRADKFFWVDQRLEGDLKPLLRQMALGAALELGPRLASEASLCVDPRDFPQDQHLWLAPQLARLTLEILVAALSETYPNDAEKIARNSQNAFKALDSFEARWSQSLAENPSLRWAVTHHDFLALSRFLGLPQPVLLPLLHEASPSPLRLREWMKLQSQTPLSFVVLEPGYPPHMALFFKAMGVQVVELTTLAEDWGEERLQESLARGEAPYWIWLSELCEALQGAVQAATA